MKKVSSSNVKSAIVKVTTLSFFIISIIDSIELFSQQLYSVGSNLYTIDVAPGSCLDNFIGPVSGTGVIQGWTMTPGSLLISIGFDYLKEINQSTGVATNYFTIPPPYMSATYRGLASTSNDLFYTVTYETNSLLEINVSNGTVTNLGILPYTKAADITLFNGELYYVWSNYVPYITKGIVKIDITNPSNSQIIVDLQGTGYHIEGLTASNICNTLIASIRETGELLYINLIDGVITSNCVVGFQTVYVTSMAEFETQTCQVYLDLDEDDSSGAMEADYFGSDITCLVNHADVSDNDITILYDALVMEMTVEIVGSIPDSPEEFLEMNGNVQNINVSGEGTAMITLSNAGNAKSTDFKEALKLIQYWNVATDPTPGQRTVTVQFTTESGAMSNIATAFIEVIQLPLIEVDLGPDQQKCEGESATFDAGNPGAVFQWNTGAHTQSITVSDEGEYIVTVENGINCPNQDTVLLDILPIIHISLSGDDEICDNEAANLSINTDASFPIDVEITPDPGSLFTLNGITGTYSFTDLPSQSTEYVITNVTPSEDACIELQDSSQVVYVYPTYINSVSASICEGDSIWLGYYWETDPGNYEILFDSEYGCDSTVTFTIDVLPAVNISVQSTTCDSALAGTYITHLNNPNGCDTVITTTVTLLPSDTTLISLTSCNSSNTGIFTQLFTNQNGCDSLVITTINLDPPDDTTSVQLSTCDSLLVGTFQQIFPDQVGCDSLVITTVSMAPADTSFQSATSCDSAMIGVFQNLYSTPDGCDSLVILTINAGIPDTTYLSITSCDSASLGVFEMLFNSQFGCDSLVITSVTYSASDSTFISSSSCDPDQSGVFIQNLINRFGCDSIVTQTISLLPSSETFIASTTCDSTLAGDFVYNYLNQAGCDSIVYETVSLLPHSETFLNSTTCSSAQAGTFITTHINQFGCDSIVTLTVSLIPADTTLLSFKTCDPAQVGSLMQTYINQDGCDSLVIMATSLYPLPSLAIDILSDYNGSGISCAGAGDGSLRASVSGVPSSTYLWSTGEVTEIITNLSAGIYSVTITDPNGCTANDDIELTEPLTFEINLAVSEPGCFDQEKGKITITPSGGISPYRYSINGSNYQASPSFTGLDKGMYQISALDANDCEAVEIVLINVPIPVTVDLGSDRVIAFGDTAHVEALVNVPYDSLIAIQWSGLDSITCPSCLFQVVAPIVTTSYSIQVTTNEGCTDQDKMTIAVVHGHDVYVPNIFSPNGDQVNDELLITAGDDVKEISSFVIYDRWGNMVFSAEHFIAGDPDFAWEGTMKGKELRPAVFVYKLVVEFKDGRSDEVFGDVTLVR